MAQLRLELFDGHLVADAGGRFLLDTGSPVSFSNTKTARWAGQDHELATSALGLDAEELSHLVGSRLDGLLGGDLLGLHPFTVDLDRGFCTFDEPPSGRQTVELPIRLMLGVPLAALDLDGTPTQWCIDTGAKHRPNELRESLGIPALLLPWYPPVSTIHTYGRSSPGRRAARRPSSNAATA